MRYIKTFENYKAFDTGGISLQQGLSQPVGAMSQTEKDPDINKPIEVMTYLFIPNNKENEPLSARVQGEDGVVIFNVSQDLIDLEIMRTPTDLTGLHRHLTSKRKIKPQDKIKLINT
jgi:hypothetical protein